VGIYRLTLKIHGNTLLRFMKPAPHVSAQRHGMAPATGKLLKQPKNRPKRGNQTLGWFQNVQMEESHV
jgi:hypothetical protein